MKKIFVILLLSHACMHATASTSKEVYDQNVLSNGNQHIAIAMLSAMYYCKNSSWPDSLMKLKEYSNQDGVSIPHTPDWDKLQDSTVVFEVGTQLKLKTPAGDKAIGDIGVNSVNSYPKCNNGIEIDAHINLED